MQEFKQLSDTDLVSKVKTLAAEERKLSAAVIAHLEEIEKRKIYLEMGYSSLFAFCLEELGYSGDQAMRRISAMRLTREIPEARAKIEEGTLSLTNLARAQTFIREERKAGKAYSREAKRELVLSLEGLSSRECERKLAVLAPESATRDKVRAISETQTQITFVADQELMEGLEKIRNLLAHQSPDPTYLDLFKKMVKLVLAKIDPQSKPSVAAPKADKVRKRGEKPGSIFTRHIPTRHIPAQVRAHVWQRDQGKCQYVDPKSGRICASTFMVEIDHQLPYALGGGHEAENLRLLCRAHNAWEAEKMFSPGVRAQSG